MGTMEFRNPCGGRAWAVREDGVIEVEGGVLLYEPGSLQYVQMQNCYENWGCIARSKSEAVGIPTSWTLAIMTTETGLWAADPIAQAGKLSYTGAIGLMQIEPATARQYGYQPEQMYDPALNIECGTRLLGRLKSMGHDLPASAAIYNSGKVCQSSGCTVAANEWSLCGQNDYPGHVIRWNNTALTYFNLGLWPCVWKPIGLGLAVAGIGYAAAIALGKVAPPRWLRIL